MSLSEHQASIIKYLSSVETATKEDIYKNSTMSYYNNWQKYVGEVLSRMVKQRMINRVKRGVYEISGSNRKQFIEKNHAKQITISFEKN